MILLNYAKQLGRKDKKLRCLRRFENFSYKIFVLNQFIQANSMEIESLVSNIMKQLSGHETTVR